MQLDRDVLSADGFRGFLALAVLRKGGLDLVPQKPGIYVILRHSQADPAFHARNRGGRFKGRDPTVPVPELRRKWVAGANLVYVGKGSNLRRRLRQLAVSGSSPTSERDARSVIGEGGTSGSLLTPTIS
ncbi:MAG: hypothetical protein OXG37_04410 [Actinomycetia bacterium]|nr:hypothetical protein [Actinomycetes bacterium]